MPNHIQTKELKQAWGRLLNAVKIGDRTTVQRECQTFTWMNDSNSAIELMGAIGIRITSAHKHQSSPEPFVATAEILMQQVYDSHVWDHIVRTLVRESTSAMYDLWPILKTAPVQQARDTENLMRMVATIFKPVLPEWFADLVKLHSTQRFSGPLFWKMAAHPDANALTAMMQHPTASPEIKDIVNALSECYALTPSDPQKIRPYVSLNNVLNALTLFAYYEISHQRTENTLTTQMQFWWNALTEKEKKVWLKEQQDKKPFWQQVPMVQIWQQQQELQKMENLDVPTAPPVRQRL